MRGQRLAVLHQPASSSRCTEGCTGLDRTVHLHPEVKGHPDYSLLLFYYCYCDYSSSNREGQSRGSSPDSSAPWCFRQRFGPSRATRPRSCYTQVLNNRTGFSQEIWLLAAESALHLCTCTGAFRLRFLGDALETGELVLGDLVPMFTQKAQMGLIVVFWTLHCS